MVETIGEAKKIEDFFALMSRYQEVGRTRRYLFRGQSDVNWKIVPSLFRRELAGMQNYGALEINFLQEFQRRAEPHLNFRRESYLRNLMIAQHYGLPTRLLDWSYNPLVALYFAADRDHTVDASLYVLKPQASLTGAVDSVRGPKEFKHPIAEVIPSALDHRIVAQQAAFTVCELYEHDKQPFPVETADIKQTILERIVVAASAKKRIRHELRLFGVNVASLFPGLDSIGADIVAKDNEAQYR